MKRVSRSRVIAEDTSCLAWVLTVIIGLAIIGPIVKISCDSRYKVGQCYMNEDLETLKIVEVLDHGIRYKYINADEDYGVLYRPKSSFDVMFDRSDCIL